MPPIHWCSRPQCRRRLHTHSLSTCGAEQVLIQMPPDSDISGEVLARRSRSAAWRLALAWGSQDALTHVVVVVQPLDSDVAVPACFW
jgi:hypothetical protein